MKPRSSQRALATSLVVFYACLARSGGLVGTGRSPSNRTGQTASTEMNSDDAGADDTKRKRLDESPRDTWWLDKGFSVNMTLCQDKCVSNCKQYMLPGK